MARNAAGVESIWQSQCFTVSSIFTLLDGSALSWKYYQSECGPGYWKAVDVLESIWSEKVEYNANVDCNPSEFLTDIGNGKLAAGTIVTPTAAASDHAGSTDGSGVVGRLRRQCCWRESSLEQPRNPRYLG